MLKESEAFEKLHAISDGISVVQRAGPCGGVVVEARMAVYSRKTLGDAEGGLINAAKAMAKVNLLMHVYGPFLHLFEEITALQAVILTRGFTDPKDYDEAYRLGMDLSHMKAELRRTLTGR